MADVKTNLRELSVVAGLIYKINGNDPRELLDMNPISFFDFLQERVSNDILSASNIRELHRFSPEYRNIINNGIKLGEKIVELQLTNNYERIEWVGGDTQRNDLIDLKIGNIGFSLKEESYILENMGLYKYLNLLTNSDFRRGLHVFNHFAPEEYNNWFIYTWQYLLNNIDHEWVLDSGRYVSKIRIENDQVHFIIDDVIISTLPTNLENIAQYTDLTKSQSRERVFAKWISKEISNDPTYIELKSVCSNIAGQNLCDFVNNNLNPIGLARLLQIYENDYYYAKTTSNELSIFYIPRLEEYNNRIRVSDISYSVPSSQLNIKTTVTNIDTNQNLVFRNECRFSHGQFNGTPEAKMYYDCGNDLSIIYNRVY